MDMEKIDDWSKVTIFISAYDRHREIESCCIHREVIINKTQKLNWIWKEMRAKGRWWFSVIKFSCGIILRIDILNWKRKADFAKFRQKEKRIEEKQRQYCKRQSWSFWSWLSKFSESGKATFQRGMGAELIIDGRKAVGWDWWPSKAGGHQFKVAQNTQNEVSSQEVFHVRDMGINRLLW